MTPDASRQHTRTEILRLLGGLEPTPTVEWVTGETDSIMVQFGPVSGGPPLIEEVPAEPS